MMESLPVSEQPQASAEPLAELQPEAIPPVDNTIEDLPPNSVEAIEKETSVEDTVPEASIQINPAAEESVPGEEAAPETIPPEEEPVIADEPAPGEGPVTDEHSAPAADITMEPDQAHPAVRAVIPQRKPYHLRYYLLYGYESVPEGLDLEGAREFLKASGYGNSSLKQARDGKSIAELIERTFVPNRPGSHYCDFCGNELLGTEYDTLGDGRERCVACSRTAIRTEKEFVEIYHNILRNMESFYGVRITAPVSIQMVNSRKLHQKLGKTFVPTGNMDGRILGVAVRQKKTGYTILVENGAPRLQATMTMVHELTHIWQYLNWDAAQIKKLYGAAQELQIYEGMAKWSEIQYAYLINEPATAKREEIITRARQDEYGFGFLKYAAIYPLSVETHLNASTPFDNKQKPL